MITYIKITLCANQDEGNAKCKIFLYFSQNYFPKKLVFLTIIIKNIEQKNTIIFAIYAFQKQTTRTKARLI